MNMQDQKDEELKDLLEEDIELNKQNNEMLKSMARSARWGLIFTVVKWAIIIGGALGLYYYFGQLFETIYSRYNSLIGNQNATTTSFKEIFNNVMTAVKKI